MSPPVYAPVALFIYRRPEHTRRTLLSLLRCPELAHTQLYVFCDGAKRADDPEVVAARQVAHELAPPSTIFIERDRNVGLASSIIEGVDELCRRHGQAIVVEDDLEVSPTFLRFLNAGLARYADDDRVMQISAYQFPLDPPLSGPAFLAFPTSWGWATWARAWRHFDPQARGYERLARDRVARRRFDLDGSYPYFKMLRAQRAGRVDSWAIRWHLSVFQREGLVLYPAQSLVRNTGFDGSGTHGEVGNVFADRAVAADRAPEPSLPPVALDETAQQRVYGYLFRQRPTRSKRVSDLLDSWRRSILANPTLARSLAMPNALRNIGRNLLGMQRRETPSDKQDLDIYWDPKMAAVLDTWGEGNAWNEIQLLLANLRGSVVDIACGTGKVMELLGRYPALELHGYDISDFLIQKALDRGIARDRLTVTDATKTSFADDQFDYGYSIGSLEHFTEEGIVAFVRETHRVTRRASFHMIPVSRTGWNEGWMKTIQSFHNNSVDWWLERYRSAYQTVHVLDSKWEDQISLGKWFLCIKKGP